MVPIFTPLAAFLRRHLTPPAGVVLAMAMAGCASVPPPDDSMNQAQTQLQAARDAGASDYAPVDLGFAQDKFQQAQGAMAARKYADATQLAEESRADAELARAKARLAAARAQIQAKIQENDRLRVQGEAPAANVQPAPAASMDSSTDSVPAADLPAPASSSVSAPPPAGFETVPADSQPAPASSQGGQP